MRATQQPLSGPCTMDSSINPRLLSCCHACDPTASRVSTLLPVFPKIIGQNTEGIQGDGSSPCLGFADVSISCSRVGWRSTRTDIAARTPQSVQQHGRVHGWRSTRTDIAARACTSNHTPRVANSFTRLLQLLTMHSAIYLDDVTPLGWLIVSLGC
jgi:hypothetical protein